jgi:hypothetical protein
VATPFSSMKATRSPGPTPKPRRCTAMLRTRSCSASYESARSPSAGSRNGRAAQASLAASIASRSVRARSTAEGGGSGIG